MVWPSMFWVGTPPLPSGLHDEPITWLGQGARMTAYASGDGRYVVKLFRTPAQIQASFADWGIDLAQAPWSPYPGDALGTAAWLAQQALRSCVLAWRRLRVESALMRVQVQGGTPVRLTIAPDNHVLTASQFVIQRWAILNPPMLHWLTRLEPSPAEHLARALLARWG